MAQNNSIHGILLLSLGLWTCTSLDLECHVVPLASSGAAQLLILDLLLLPGSLERLSEQELDTEKKGLFGVGRDWWPAGALQGLTPSQGLLGMTAAGFLFMTWGLYLLWMLPFTFCTE